MAQYWINRDVSGLPDYQIQAAGYHVEDTFIHFFDAENERVLSIQKSVVQVIERM
ncbi:hypothetical protein [Kitasatospora cineracea]|uniref:Uncharacterized protein n=1 Tax=Kitasatospora cineracea TaxID=88074 RepID=A0A8G1XE70_9ACTN|nr:hypothetical protein [Kitasatospora cineracea]ROR42532.1 hypothetical protein EDD39_0656 [Kitasatospora cineracea]